MGFGRKIISIRRWDAIFQLGGESQPCLRELEKHIWLTRGGDYVVEAAPQQGLAEIEEAMREQTAAEVEQRRQIEQLKQNYDQSRAEVAAYQRRFGALPVERI